ncbi:hypothetical protein BKA61DRAFT_640057 [Leptodontidium sp. MPI-SDFR-AT-0119]|nr:hypothetical protein BKA61DRAFT_640057 [Leptodontidium sp. MPI-SDFR-AT-0119]
MDYDKRKHLIQEVQKDNWIDKVNAARVDGRMCSWITTFHPDQLRCGFDGGFLNGSYNLCQKFRFSDNTTWILRFPRVGAICEDNADEKVAMEVEVLSLIRERTSIPVPKLYSWGLAVDNPLGLGAFILIEFIEGTTLNHLLKDLNPAVDSRLIREGISDNDIELLFRQISCIQLQLFELDFDRIGSLPTPKTGFSAPIRPLTWKVHEIIQTGGVNTFGNRTQGFSTTTEYFESINRQDSGPYDAENKYISFKLLASPVPGYVNKKYDQGPFKLVCDDLGLGNLIVKSDDDLTIVGVVDLEWSYAGPAQLFASAPWWLLQDRPPPDCAARYFKYLEIYKRVLEEEEAKRPGHEKKDFSSLVKWSETSGAMWLHMLLSCGFNDTYSFPFTQLRQHVGIEKWRKSENAVDLGEYDAELAKIEADKACVDRGEMERADFLAIHDHALVDSNKTALKT